LPLSDEERGTLRRVLEKAGLISSLPQIPNLRED